MEITLQKLLRYRKFFGLYVQSRLYSLVNHGFFGKPAAIPASRYDRTLLHADHPVVTALSSAYVSQFNEAACSVASVATILNAGKSLTHGKAQGQPITQQEILRNVDAADWSERVSPQGHRNRRGMPLDYLGRAVEKAFSVYDIPCASIVTVPLFGRVRNRNELQRELFERLAHLIYNPNCFLLAHFNQGVFIKGLHLPHISPVGDVDMDRRMVCMLDVDPDVTEPYWISFDTFWKGVAWQYNGVIRRHGYQGGGYIWIRLKRQDFQKS